MSFNSIEKQVTFLTLCVRESELESLPLLGNALSFPQIGILAALSGFCTAVCSECLKVINSAI